MKYALSFLSLCAVLSASAQTLPSVVTDTRYASGRTKAYGRITSIKSNGNIVIERGFCWSESNALPTIDDNHSSKKLSNNVIVMSDLTPATKYYARAYAKTSNGDVAYGDPIKFYTIATGRIDWDYDNGADADANARINAAVGGCVDYWREYTSIDGLYLSVHYGSGTPTADCSYGGWMRIGPNASYQRIGTVMHEALHAIGVGTTGYWYNGDSPVRPNGDWIGERVNRVLKFWTNNDNEVLHGDGMHMWPYGINGAQEDNGSEELYVGCSLIAQALAEDGLPTTGSRPFGIAHYGFEQEDDVKYYIKSESDKYGFTTSYLVETADHKLQWQTLTAEAAIANDAAAWYVTFNPATQLYQFRNAGTGYYMTYTQSGTNGIATAQTETSKSSFMLMRGRTDITSAQGTKLTNERGYWIINPDYSTNTPNCLTAGANGATSASAYSNINTAQQQRWLILNEKQAKGIENSGLAVAREAFDLAMQQAKDLVTTPHNVLVDEADETFQGTLQSLQTSVEKAESPADINALTTQLKDALKTFLQSVYVSDVEHPFDFTGFIVNPGFDNGITGWAMVDGSSCSNSEVEFYQTTNASAIQLIKDMPSGTFKLCAQGFQRPGSNDAVLADYTAGTNRVTVRLYMTMTSKEFASALIHNVMDERFDKSLHSGDKQLSDGSYVPNTMAAARAHFDAGHYDNSVTGYTENSGDLRIYLRGSNSKSSSWTIFDNFRLYYYGPLTLEEIENKLTAITQIHDDASTLDAPVYNLYGQRLGADAKGFVIVGGKKVFRH